MKPKHLHPDLTRWLPVSLPLLALAGLGALL